MTKKNKKVKDSKVAENETAEDQAGLTGTAPTGSEAEATAPEETAAREEQSASDEASMDDLLDDVRRSLIEAEAQAEEKKPGWLSRITKGFQKEPSAAAASEELEAIPATSEVPEAQPKEAEYLSEIDDLIEMLEPEPSVEEAKLEPAPTVETAPEPEPTVDMEELKKRVFSPGAGSEVQEASQVRAVALEGGEEVFVEVEARKEDASQERMKAFENSLRPYRQYLFFAIAVFGVVMAVLAVGLMYTAYQRTLPPEPTPIPSNLPHPVAMTLPGGLNFNLGTGAIRDGSWNPAGPEWLQGTEICRWVAIPWSTQLEAVVRTLTKDDSIELVMSNDDRLSYDVFSIQQLTLEEMQALDQNSPCLLLVLAEQDAEERWVVTAKP